MTDETNNTEHSSFAIAIDPEFDENGAWTGNVQVCIEESLRDDLDEDQLLQVRSVCGMMASTLALMEQDPEFLEYVHNYFHSTFEKALEYALDEIEDDTKPVFTKEGNVIKLDFNTKTYGNA